MTSSASLFEFSVVRLSMLLLSSSIVVSRSFKEMSVSSANLLAGESSVPGTVDVPLLEEEGEEPPLIGLLAVICPNMAIA